uniref:Uncharacterized protein n=1 Tax=Anguilla anguilla TaxID=7936 RepID=A0A0E9RRA7_ANGAN
MFTQTRLWKQKKVKEQSSFLRVQQCYKKVSEICSLMAVSTAAFSNTETTLSHDAVNLKCRLK